MILEEQIQSFRPYNEQEEKDREQILSLMKSCDGLFERSSRMFHFTASSWIVNYERTKVLLVYHNIYDSWSWTGGHADGETNLLKKAVSEAREETGIRHIRPVSEDIFSLEIITVDGHEKRGEYVNSHLHLNVTYLLEADENDELTVKEDENSAVGWFDVNQVAEVSTEPWMVKRIYDKLNGKLGRL